MLGRCTAGPSRLERVTDRANGWFPFGDAPTDLEGVLNDGMNVAWDLLRLDDGDAASSQLVKRGLGGNQFMNGGWHTRDLLDAADGGSVRRRSQSRQPWQWS